MSVNKGVSELLVDFIYELKYDDLPQEVILQAKKCLLDYLGTTLYGATTPTADKIRNFSLKFDDKPKITAIGNHQKTELFKAALANGISSHVLELDDGERYARVHPGTSIISALLPLIEKENIGGKELVTGIVSGYEVALRMGRAIQPSHRNRGFHGTATCGTLGAAVAAAKVLGLSREEMLYSLGIAGTSASGLLQFLEDGSEIKQYHPGKAALCGLLSAYLAQSGLTAPNNILEGKRAFFQATSDEYNVSECTNSLGKKFAILDVYFKLYASCRHCHAPIEATLNLRSQSKIANQEIEKIEVSTYKSAVDGHDNPIPQSEVGAKMSLPFSVAVAWKKGWAGPEEFTPVYFNNPEILSLAQKVEVKEDPSLTQLVPAKRPAIVRIFSQDGHKFEERVDLPKGEPENPVTEKELKEKFRSLASISKSKEEIENIINIVETAEERIGEIFSFID